MNFYRRLLYIFHVYDRIVRICILSTLFALFKCNYGDYHSVTVRIFDIFFAFLPSLIYFFSLICLSFAKYAMRGNSGKTNDWQNLMSSPSNFRSISSGIKWRTHSSRSRRHFISSELISFIHIGRSSRRYPVF